VRQDNGATFSYYFDAFGNKQVSLIVHAGATLVIGDIYFYSLTVEAGAELYASRIVTLVPHFHGYIQITPLDADSLPREFRYLYTSQEWDPIAGLYYYDNRWYDSTTGRYFSQNPLEFSAGDGNLYRYAYNNPLNFTDPSGMQPIQIGFLGQWLNQIIIF
jgi:RHS repeat-associated protein